MLVAVFRRLKTTFFWLCPNLLVPKVLKSHESNLKKNKNPNDKHNVHGSQTLWQVKEIRPKGVCLMYDFIYMKFQIRQNSTGGSKQNSDCPQSRLQMGRNCLLEDGIVLYIWWLHKIYICENSNHIHKMDCITYQKEKPNHKVSSKNREKLDSRMELYGLTSHLTI